MKQISGAYQSSYGDDEGGASFWRSLAALPLLTGWMSSSKPAQIRCGPRWCSQLSVAGQLLFAFVASPPPRPSNPLSFFPQSSTED
ncbi:hypothetical protein MUK42_35725 [Musa troglodytarum]|uniref:Uncharacterized protein n=1 Tax=Musa troglodytarum TaxID=320322 RepID=A0A9E7KDU2_9LILI|nr:hypothetical protein MUK42_35725 [Musa troglodytarum]